MMNDSVPPAAHGLAPVALSPMAILRGTPIPTTTFDHPTGIPPDLPVMNSPTLLSLHCALTT
ncbi:MAG TPA: hypothetical protein VLJ39_18555 [Tepidisphaeraceae bacterium]|nr:hypothetical protein [Tepidisphaeraceae bacterium]